ncbi:MAG: basic secretory protein-like protein [Bacteroidales bacterium]|nr:basic secretory protein-like protein [Bacteroidales bacterium]
MNRILLFVFLSFVFLFTACKSETVWEDEDKDIEKLEIKWKSYNFQDFQFVDLAPETQGSKIYHGIIKNPSLFIRQNAIRVLETLYYSPLDSIPERENIHYSLSNFSGITEKTGESKTIAIRLSTQWIEKTFSPNDSTASFIEMKGLLLHQLTYAYLFNPVGCGTYLDNKDYRAYVEGLGDAVRILNGGFHDSKPKEGGSYYSGYRTTGYFYCWLVKNKDSDFIKKLNKTAVNINPWSTEKAFRQIFGPNEKFTVENLWNEYQKDLNFF